MRGYFVPLTAGLLLTASTFLPWVNIGDTALRGMPTVTAVPVDPVAVVAQLGLV